MIGQTLVLVCAALGLAAGSCLPVRSQCSNVVLPEFFGNNGLNNGLNGMNNGMGCGSQLVGSVVASPVQVLGGSNAFSGSVFGNSFSNGLDGNVNGPETAPLPVLQAPSVTLPTVEAPLVTLSAPAVPAPRVLASRCVCTKTIVKPQVYQRVVTVPKVQRYFKRTVTPVVENLIYKSRPLTACSGAVGSGLVSGSGVVGSGLVSGSGLVGSAVVGSGCSSSVVASPVIVSSGVSGCRTC